MFTLLYIFIYYNIDGILNKLYLSNQICDQNELIKHNLEFNYSITQVNIFALTIYSIYLIKNILNYNSINKPSFVLALVYLKYTLTSLLSENITLCQYDFSRNIMWLFTTPLMIKMYCDANNIELFTMNIQYHVIPVVINIFIYPYKLRPFYYYFTAVSWVLLFVFVKPVAEYPHACS